MKNMWRSDERYVHLIGTAQTFLASVWHTVCVCVCVAGGSSDEDPLDMGGGVRPKAVQLTIRSHTCMRVHAHTYSTAHSWRKLSDFIWVSKFLCHLLSDGFELSSLTTIRSRVANWVNDKIFELLFILFLIEGRKKKWFIWTENLPKMLWEIRDTV